MDSNTAVTGTETNLCHHYARQLQQSQENETHVSHFNHSKETSHNQGCRPFWFERQKKISNVACLQQMVKLQMETVMPDAQLKCS